MGPQKDPGLSKEREGELYALQHWLDQDTQSRTQEQARMQQLDQAIANLQQAQFPFYLSKKSTLNYICNI